ASLRIGKQRAVPQHAATPFLPVQRKGPRPGWLAGCRFELDKIHSRISNKALAIRSPVGDGRCHPRTRGLIGPAHHAGEAAHVFISLLDRMDLFAPVAFSVSQPVTRMRPSGPSSTRPTTT